MRLLSCNVIVYKSDDGGVVVNTVNPTRLVGITDNPDLNFVSDRFDRVLDRL